MGRSTFRSQKCQKLTGPEHFWTFRCRFAWQAQGIVHRGKSEQNVRVLWHFQKRWQAWGHLKMICKGASPAAGAAQETCSSELLGCLASWLRTSRFSEPTFRPSGATNHWKNTVFRGFPTFSRTWIFFLLRLSPFGSFFFSSLLRLFPSLLFICPYCQEFAF